MPIIKEYSCGCIGFVVRGGMSTDLQDHEVMCIRACDRHDERDMVFERRDGLRNKRGRKLDEDEVEDLFNDIGELVADGYALRELRSALRVAGVCCDDELGITSWQRRVARRKA